MKKNIRITAIEPVEGPTTLVMHLEPVLINKDELKQLLNMMDGFSILAEFKKDEP